MDPEPLALDELGWRQFLDLCVAVLEVDAGVSAAGWASDADRHWHASVPAGLKFSSREALPGPCHVRALWIPDRADQRRAGALEAELLALRDELERWTGSVAVITNYAGVFSDRTRLRECLAVEHAALLGPGWLSQRIDGNPKLRTAMPSLLSLGDLERWVPTSLRARSTIDLSAARALAEVFVPTAAYRRALGVLGAHRFAVLTGPPEMGKTSIARMIALALLTDGWEAHECATPEVIFRSFRDQRAQVFVADDAFGSTEYRPDAAERWARDMERLLRMMDDQHWLIWTSRPAPLRAGLGRIHRERGAERFPRPGEVLVDASKLSLDEKVLILLRHAKAKVWSGVRSRVRGAGYAIVSHPHFTPERIRRLVATEVRALAEGAIADLEKLIERQIQTPTDAMSASFSALSDEHQALLFALLDAAPGPVEERQIPHLVRLHHPQGFSRSPMEVVERLTDHFLRVTDALKVDWVHPSWRDLVIDRLRRDTKARAAFLERCTVEGLLLAISTAGGASGARALALLLADRDWDLVTDQVARAMRDASDRDVIRLLDALANAAEEAGELSQHDLHEIRALAGSALLAATARCDRHAKPIEVDVIGAWLRLARRIPEQIATPRLDRTWTELLPSETIDLRLSGELDQATAWLRLADLLDAYAPEQLHLYGFPERHRGRIEALIGQAERLVAAHEQPSAPDRLAQLVRLCRQSGTLAPAAKARCDHMIWEAGPDPALEQPIDTAEYADLRVRQHVERILEDL